MPKYLFQGSYIGEGLKGLATEGGTPRVDAAKKLRPSRLRLEPFAPHLRYASALS